MKKQNSFFNAFVSFFKSTVNQFSTFQLGITFLTVFLLSTTATWAANTVDTYAPTGATQTWTCPAGVTSITVECWGGGGAGGGAKWTAGTNSALGGGGSGGGYAKKVITVSPGTGYSLFVGAGGVSIVPTTDDVAAASGGASYFINATTVKANGGIGGKGRIITTGAASILGAGGVFVATGQAGTAPFYNGGDGSIASSSLGMSGGGGGSAGTTSSGNAGGNTLNGTATVAVTGGGTGGAPFNAVSRDGYAGGAPGGGGGGAKANSGTASRLGGDGGAGKITITYVNPVPVLTASATTLSGFSYLLGAGPSTSQQTNISATNLTGFPANLTVTAPIDYEVSLDNTTFTPSVSVPFTSATLASTPIYIRLLSGLTSGNYTAENVAISGGGLASAYNIACSGSVGGTYTWNGSGGVTNWNIATAWTPTRTTPTTLDQLTIDMGGSISLTNLPAAQTIAQLKVANNTTVELRATQATVITIAGATGTDLDVAAGSTLILGGGSAINLALSTGATGTIAGNVTFNGITSGTGVNHQITSPDVAGVTFASGAIMTAGANFTGVPFGTTPNGAVIFSTGSTYIHASGDTPFGGSNAVNVATFNIGSLYKFTGVVGTVGTVVTAKPAVAAKAYGNYEVNTTSIISNSNPAGNFSFENITVNGTSFAISGNTNGATATIKGNVSIGTGGGITFGLASAVSPVIFGGTLPQIITLTDNGFFTIGAGSVMSVNNDLTLDGDITLNGTVNVATGKPLTIATGKILTLGATATLNNSGILLNLGTLANSGTFTNTGFLVNVSSNDNAMGTVSGSVSGAADVTLLATAKSGYHFVNWTEAPTGEIGNVASFPVFTVTADRTLVANFSIGTGINSMESINTFVTVDGRILKLNGNINAVEVFSAQGKLIVSKTQNANTIALNANGIYFVKMYTTQGVNVQKVYIQ